jgi:hypothetical protein
MTWRYLHCIDVFILKNKDKIQSAFLCDRDQWYRVKCRLHEVMFGFQSFALVLSESYSCYTCWPTNDQDRSQDFQLPCSEGMVYCISRLYFVKSWPVTKPNRMRLVGHVTHVRRLDIHTKFK